MDRKRKAALCLFMSSLIIKRRRFNCELLPLINRHLSIMTTTTTNILSASSLLRNVHIRMENFYEEWIHKYLETDFFAHFRMTPYTFNQLLIEIGPLKLRNPRFCGSFIPLEKGLLMTLWFLAKGDTLISISDRFNVSISSVHENTEQIIDLLIELKNKFIRWPTKDECTLISKQFFQKSGYSNVIGAIDGCHINCKVPESQHDSYSNRKMSHSVILQGICTVSKLLTNICVGFPGSVHDARVLKGSAIYANIAEEGKEKYFFDKYHLVGDSAYPCLEWLMTPYRDNGRLTAQQRRHNTTLSRARVVIENVYGLLKGRWRILKYVDVYTIKKVIKIICACCVLHNFCYVNDDLIDEDQEEVDSDSQESHVTTEDFVFNIQGATKRDNICRRM